MVAMKRTLALAAVVLLCAGPAFAAGITGQYIEARTCDVWTGPCFANAEMNLGGKHAVVGWKVDKGTLNGTALDGLGIVAVIGASDTLGLKQTGPARAVLIVDSRASAAQCDALVHLAKAQGGELTKNVVAVRTAPIDLEICPCHGNGCAKLNAGDLAKIETRCVDVDHDKVCGNESAFYPPLVRGVKAKPAVAVEHRYTGTGVQGTWNDAGRRSAYLGSFEMP
jgi:hypothetical protein